MPNQEELTGLGTLSNKIVKPFDEKSRLFCKGLIGFSIKFEFSDESIMSLIQIVTNFPKLTEQDRRKTLVIGSSINRVSPEKLFELLASAYMRVNI